MYYYEGIKTAAKLINLTDKTIQVYDKCSGEIVTIHPESRVLPPEPQDEDLMNQYFYVFSKKVANRLKRNGRSLHDIAIIKNRRKGRNDSDITSLVWGEDIGTEIGFCEILNHH